MNLVSREKAIDVAIDEYNRGYKEGFEAGKASVSGGGDLISRQAAIDALDAPIYNIKGKDNAERMVEYLQTVIRRIKNLPPAQPELIKVSVDHAMTEEELKELKQKIANSPVVLLPSAQPEIIRCKDCKHSFLHNNGERTSRICGLTRMCGTTPDDWYCGDAERRTDGAD